jgi:hypothetical protein
VHIGGLTIRTSFESIIVDAVAGRRHLCCILDIVQCWVHEALYLAGQSLEKYIMIV